MAKTRYSLIISIETETNLPSCNSILAQISVPQQIEI